MLIDVGTGKGVTNVPYAKEYRSVMSRLSKAEITAMKDELNRKIDAGDIHTAGWMPGSDWRGTPFQPLYEKGAAAHYTVAARMFGLLVWEVFMERPERWGSGRFDKDGKDIGSRTYFLLSGP